MQSLQRSHKYRDVVDDYIKGIIAYDNAILFLERGLNKYEKKQSEIPAGEVSGSQVFNIMYYTALVKNIEELIDEIKNIEKQNSKLEPKKENNSPEEIIQGINKDLCLVSLVKYKKPREIKLSNGTVKTFEAEYWITKSAREVQKYIDKMIDAGVYKISNSQFYMENNLKSKRGNSLKDTFKHRKRKISENQ